MPNARQAGRQSQRRAAQMASKIGKRQPQWRRVGGKPAGDHQAGDRGHTRSHRARHITGYDRASAFEKPARVSPRRRQDHCRERRRPVETGGITDDAVDIVFEVQRVAPHQFAIVAHFPTLVQKAAGEAFSPRAAAEDHDIAAQECSAGRDIYDRFAPQPGAVEQDRLGWQKLERGASSDRQGLLDRRRAPGRPIDLLRRRRGNMRHRSRCELDVDIEPVAGDEPTRSRDDDG